MAMLGACFLINIEWRLQDFPGQERRHKDAPAFLACHLVSNVTGTAGIELGMRLLQRPRHDADILHVVIFASVPEFLACKCEFQDVDRLLMTRTAFFKWQG